MKDSGRIMFGKSTKKGLMKMLKMDRVIAALNLILLFSGCFSNSKENDEDKIDLEYKVQNESDIIPVAMYEYDRGEVLIDLGRTKIVPILDIEIKPGLNYVFCSTMQLLWDKVKENNQDFTPFNKKQSIYINTLNKQNYKNSVNESDYIAVYGDKNDAEKEIIKQMKKKFDISENEFVFPDDNTFLAYSYLRKNLPFEYVFDSDNLKFGNSKVKAFSTSIPEVIQQVLLRYCAFSAKEGFRKNDFVVELKTTNHREEIVLAKVRPKSNLHETYKWISGIVGRGNFEDSFYSELIGEDASISFPRSLSESDYVSIPEFNFRAEKEFEELNNTVINNSGRAIIYNHQIIDFSLDREGMKLISEATASDSIGAFTIPPIVFDEPFLLYAKEKGARYPYLVIWIQNSDILMKIE